MLTIAKLKRWSINYYIDTAQAAEHAAKDRARSGGGLGNTTPNVKRAPGRGSWSATLTPSRRWSV
jgi:hypothetical protein